MRIATACCLGDRRQEPDDLLLAADVEVREGLVQQQQPGLGDQRVGDEGPLQLTSRELADAGVGKAAERQRRRASRRPTAGGYEKEAGCPNRSPSMPESHQVPRPQGHVRVETDALGDVADGPVATRTRPATEEHPARSGRLQAEDHLEYGRLARAVGPDEAGELPGMETEPDFVEDLAARQPERDTLEGEDLLVWDAGPANLCHRCSVETLSATALSRAWTSASIQVW